MLKAIPLIPNGINPMQSYSLRKEGTFPKVRWIAVMEYEDCTREFDGVNWKITEDKRKQPSKNIFDDSEMLISYQ